VAILLILPVLPLVTAAPVDAATYRFLERFDVDEPGNLQGLAYGGGSLWACFDVGKGQGRIVRYSMTGTVQKRSPRLPLGHCAEIAYRRQDGTIYAVDHVPGGKTAHVRVVDMSLVTPAVVKTIDVTRYGPARMIAVDNARDELVVFGGRTPYRFNFLTLSGAKRTTRVTWRRQVRHRPWRGIPQGLEVVGGELLFLTSIPFGGTIVSNRIRVFGRALADKRFINVPLAREAEGLAINPATHFLFLGFHHTPAVYRMDPAYRPTA
jgi:hypothetical protein